MIRCAYCDSVTLALDLNGVDAHVCPLCGAVFARKNKKSYALVADLHGAQGVKELLHSLGKYGTNRYGHNEEFVKSMTADCSALCKTRQHSAPHRC